jgi:hypothetical protein
LFFFARPLQLVPLAYAFFALAPRFKQLAVRLNFFKRMLQIFPVPSVRVKQVYAVVEDLPRADILAFDPFDAAFPDAFFIDVVLAADDKRAVGTADDTLESAGDVLKAQRAFPPIPSNTRRCLLS